MFSWSRGEVWLAVVLSVFIIVGGAAHLWLSYERLQGATVIVEAAAPAEAIMEGEGSTESNPHNHSASPSAVDEESSAHEEPASDAASDHIDTRININTASASELQRLPGIGPALAARIIEYREAWGPFSTIEDIMEVSGIGPRKFEDIKDLIKVD